jgi:hypothetical protein
LPRRIGWNFWGRSIRDSIFHGLCLKKSTTPTRFAGSRAFWGNSRFNPKLHACRAYIAGILFASPFEIAHPQFNTG